MESTDIKKVRTILTATRDACLAASKSALQAEGLAVDTLADMREERESSEVRIFAIREVLARSGFVEPK